MAAAKANESGHHADAATREPPGKRPTGLSLDIVTTGGGAGAGLDVAVTVTADESTSDVDLRLAAGRGAELTGTTGRQLGQLDEGESVQLRTTVQLTAERGTVDVTAVSAEARAFTQLFLLTDGDRVLRGTQGFLVLELERIDARLARGEISAAEARVSRETVLGPADESVAIVTDRAAGDITVEGTIRYADRNGALHPARGVRVQIWDIDTTSADDLLATVTTTNAGAYTWTGSNDDCIGCAGQDIVVRALAEGAGFRVVTPNASTVHRMSSSEQSDVPDDATITVDLTGGNPANSDNHAAFSVADALIVVTRYMSTIATRPASVDIVFPGTGSFYNGSTINLLRLDRYDWDVTHHEYFHYVADVFNLDNNPGGSHSSSENLAERLGKDVGTRLAWGEGQPTFWGTVAQAEMNAASLAVPFVGDTRYTDTEDASLDYDLEADQDGLARGEDAEGAISRVLWDVYDNGSEPHDPSVAKGDQWIWDRIDGATPVRIADAWGAFVSPVVPTTPVTAAKESIGCIFTGHDIAPQPTSPADGASVGATPPTFMWSSNGGGPSFRNDEFHVEVYTDSWTLLLRSPNLTNPMWTPTAQQWSAVVGNPSVQWIVKGQSSSAPATGWYISCQRDLTVSGGGGGGGDVLACNVFETFDAGLPNTWSVVNNVAGNPVVWSNVAGSGEAANYTGGGGDAASVSSDAVLAGAFDTELRTATVAIPAAASVATVALVFEMNYQSLSSIDFLDVDISTDAGATWTTLASYNEDHGAFRDTPGASISLDLTSHRGDDVVLRWRHYDPGNLPQGAWYAQIDDVGLDCVGTCAGQTATITGTAGDDILSGTSGPDVIAGLGGDDTIRSFGGDDLVCGGADDDNILAGGADDQVFGEHGNDTANGGPGTDVVDGGPGNDDLNGGSGDDRVVGAGGNDVLNGGPGQDIVTGAGGNDDMRGAVGDDTLRGGPGADTIRANGGDDLVYGDGGHDPLLSGGAGGDTVYGGVGNDNLQGNFGLDALNGQAGNDTLNGGIGIDALNGGGGLDTCNGGIDGAADTATACETLLNIP